MKSRSMTLLIAILLAPTFNTFGQEVPSALETSKEGWIDLVAKAGPELKGWTRIPIPAPPAGKLNPKSQWSVDAKTGNLVCEGNLGHEWLRWDDEVADSIYHVEFRYTAVEGKKGYNSGVYARNSSDGTIWHQAQIGSGSGGYLFGESEPRKDGKLTRFNIANKPKESRVKPAGEWNTLEITCKGKTMSLWVNGAVTAVFDHCEVAKGHVGVEAEGYRIEFRNVKLKPLP